MTDEKTEAQVDPLAVTETEKNGETLVNTSVKLNAVALNYAMADKVVKDEAKTLFDTLVNVKAEH